MISVLIKSDKSFDIDSKKIRETVIQILEKLGLNNAEVSIAFVDRAKIRELNKKYRKQDKPTSILSFSQQSGLPFISRPEKTLNLGDIVVCPPVAKTQNLAILDLVVHGVKNLLSEISSTKNLGT